MDLENLHLLWIHIINSNDTRTQQQKATPTLCIQNKNELKTCPMHFDDTCGRWKRQLYWTYHTICDYELPLTISHMLKRLAFYKWLEKLRSNGVESIAESVQQMINIEIWVNVKYTNRINNNNNNKSGSHTLAQWLDTRWRQRHGVFEYANWIAFVFALSRHDCSTYYIESIEWKWHFWMVKIK